MIGMLRRISVAMATLPLVWIGAVQARAGLADEALEQVKSKVESKKAILVDVREKREWNRGHLKGTLLIPLSTLLEWEREGVPAAEKAKLAKAMSEGSVIYCHCASGVRSVTGAEVLRKLGYEARPLKVSYKALLDAGFPAAPAGAGAKSK